MIQKGLTTTLMSNFALIISAYVTGQAIGADIYLQLALVGGATLLAFLDVKYPETIDKIEKYLGMAKETQAKVDEMLAMAKGEEELAVAKVIADEPVIEEEGV